MDDPCALVRATSEWVVAQPSAVTIDDGAVTALADALDIDELYTLKAFDADLHLCNPPDSPELTCAYLLVVDTLNFCFWPDAAAGGAELQYADLAGGVKRAVLRDPTCISAPALAAITEEGVQRLVGWRRPLPLAAERARLLREAGAALVAGYGGSAAALVRAAGGSAVQLVRLLTTDMPGFRDQAVYAGRQVFFYKRAQIFAGDLYGAFGGQGLGAFRDVAQLTMFADYRVPQILREKGVLQYAPGLAARVDGLEEIPAGSEAEVEVRAATVVAVERLRAAVGARHGRGRGPPLAVAVDWVLWEAGEAAHARCRPHHRTRTIFY